MGFLAYHDEDILFWQRVAVTVDLIMLAYFWPKIRSVDGNVRGWLKQATGLPWLLRHVRQWRIKTTGNETVVKQSEQSDQPTNHISGRPVPEGGLSVITVFSVLVFSWGIAVLPDSKQEIRVRDWLSEYAFFDWKSICQSKFTGEHYFKLTEQLFDGIYRGNRLCKEPEYRIFNRNLNLRGQLLIANELSAEDEAGIDSNDSKKQKFAIEKVRGLVISGRDLRYADFSNAFLPKMDFYGSDEIVSKLQYANFSNAVLVGAIMIKTDLEKADLYNARLQGANLYKANLQKANLYQANLQGAYLERVKLKGADLQRAKLQGSNLFDAKSLNETNLREASLQGANLHTANLQNMDLIGVGFQGANLREAELQGASITESKFKGSDLSDSNLQNTSFENVDLKLANITDIKFEPVHFTGAYKLNNQTERNDYENSLIPYLINLACEDRWIAEGIIQYRFPWLELANSAAQCLLSLKNQKNQYNRSICPAISEIDYETLKLLKEIEAENLDNNITPNFECRTNRSDSLEVQTELRIFGEAYG